MNPKIITRNLLSAYQRWPGHRPGAWQRGLGRDRFQPDPGGLRWVIGFGAALFAYTCHCPQ